MVGKCGHSAPDAGIGTKSNFLRLIEYFIQKISAIYVWI
jgi:hypothetical protein